MSTISQQLDKYLTHYRVRLKKVLILKGSAILVLVILIVSVVGAMFAIRTGFSSDTVISSRLILITAIAAVVIIFLFRPLNLLKENLPAILESRSSAFKGRIETYMGMGEKGIGRGICKIDVIWQGQSQ